ncbi:GTP-binding protein YPTM2 [Vitis vinifera]|uniref:GTP-binding protein YPTM2 n=1 Tax=Vitis vinifera TaxID=29760 RepID=A0A438DQE6_VITVI|nr:GTP-binding protein YPTM2 [Vitis vinifera]
MNYEYDHLFKILLVGDSGVGKSCLLLRYADDTYSEAYISTIGVDLKFAVWSRMGGTLNFKLWFMIVTDQESFDNVKMWVKEVYSTAGKNVNIFLLGNKSDLTADRVVSYKTAKALADEIGAPLMEISAKDGSNVQQAFIAMATAVKERVVKERATDNGRDSGVKTRGKPISQSRSCCGS